MVKDQKEEPAIITNTNTHLVLLPFFSPFFPLLFLSVIHGFCLVYFFCLIFLELQEEKDSEFGSEDLLESPLPLTVTSRVSHLNFLRELLE